MSAARAAEREPGARRPAGGSPAFRVRFRVPLTVVPPVAGVATAIPLWHSHAETEFFSASAHVIALGGIGLAIQGRFFRLRPHVTGHATTDAYAILNLVTVLVAVGVGLFFSFRALAHGEARTPDLPLVAGAMAAAVAAFAVIALFGNPGEIEEEDEDG
ncbi:MAG TPA: hypothetical protein VF712_19985 [Thermoleophilaceae bacterium]